MFNLNREELAWAAGFLDGEGYFGLHKSHGRPTDKRAYYRPYISAAQCDRQVLDRLQACLQMGVVKGPYLRIKKNHNDAFLFYVCNFEKAQAAIALLWYWLSPVKRAQAKEALLDFKEICKRPRLRPGPVPKIPTCHPERKHGALGLCENCYQAEYNRSRRNANKT